MSNAPFDPAFVRALDDAAQGRPLDDEVALALAEIELDRRTLDPLEAAAGAARDRRWGRTVTYSPKVFLPLTNLCRNRCDYCSFRRSPDDEGAHTMPPDEVRSQLEAARALGCVEALFCLGDKPEGAFSAYRQTLATFGEESTVSYLVRAARDALSLGLLPHTNAGVLTLEDMAALRPVNVSLGLMLESASERLCLPGMPHHRAPDKRPARRLRMIDEAGQLRIPFTTGILIGIGETRRERVEALLAIRAQHQRHAHIQEVIVQNFRAPPQGVPMALSDEPDDLEIAHTGALARLILPPEISLQAPPNLNPRATATLLRAGLNDFGGISPLTPDFINPRHPWPHLRAFAEQCHDAGFTLSPRLPIYPSYLERDGFLDESLRAHVASATLRLREQPPHLQDRPTPQTQTHGQPQTRPQAPAIG